MASGDELRRVVGDPAVAGGDRPCPGSGLGGRCRAAGAAAARGAAPRRLAAPCRRAGGAARLSVRGDAVHHLPGRLAVARPGPDRALAHLPRRLRRDDLAGADDGGRHGRLRPRRARHQQRRRDQPRLALVGGHPGGALHLRPGGDADRLAVGAHRRHLHDHDHAGDRRRLLLPGAAELQRLQRLPGAARDLPAQGAGHRLARPGAVLLPRRSPAPWPAMASSAGWCGRRSASPCRASATTPGA